MKIVIAGSGDTGTHLAKMLSYEHQDVTLISDDKEYLASLDSVYNLMVAVGDPTSRADLEAVGAGSADLFVAVTPSETVNLLSASMARYTGAGGCVARVSKNEYLDPGMQRYFTRLGVDTLVYPEALVADEIKSFLNRNWVTSWFELCAGQLVLAGVKMPVDAPLLNRPLRDIPELHDKLHVSAIRRNHKIIIPGGNDLLRENDVAYFSLSPVHTVDLQRLTGRNDLRVHDIMIAGCGAITRMLAGKLKGYRLTVVDSDAERCRRFSAEFPDAAVINTSIKDITTLQNEGLERTDLFIGLDPGAETNIVSCIMAREMGVKRTIAEIEDIQYIPEAERLWIDKVVNKKLTTSSTILRYIMGSNLRVESLISLPDTEVAEIEAHEYARIVRAPVRELKLSRDLTLGGVIREGKAMLVDGNTQILPGDRVMVIFMPGALQDVMKLFHK